MRLAQQFAKAAHQVQIRWEVHTERLGINPQQIGNPSVEFGPAVQHPFGKAEPDHRRADRPIPMIVDFQTPKQRFIASEQLGQGVEKQ